MTRRLESDAVFRLVERQTSALLIRDHADADAPSGAGRKAAGLSEIRRCEHEPQPTRVRVHIVVSHSRAALPRRRTVDPR